VARIYVRDDERLTCEIRPVEEGGFELVWTQDGEHHIEHFSLESQAKARSSHVEESLLLGGWSIAADSYTSLAEAAAVKTA
jgi:hypothetical protein